jgi:anti-sigma regulatory factor (Ser/Thr protein kinase)
MPATTSGRRASPAEFDPSMRSIPAARRLVLESLGDDPVDRDLIALLTSELVTNAICHARTDFQVDVIHRGGAVQVGVTDGDPVPPRLIDAPVEAQSGRGLQFVSHYASDWGVERRGDGKRVWFELPLGPRPTV